jgi:hypothetical protein|tara:strand:+ start:149 stop:466 length:318 start_codon:yes stop_codon:yes gene_type:complete
MPKIPKGEMTVSEIRNLARQHNRVSEIKGIDKKPRKALLLEIKNMGYAVDHAKKRIVKLPSKKATLIKQDTKANPKPNRVTRKKVAKKKLIQEGGAVPLVGGDEV